jgi:hypothetical protein
MSFVNFYAGLDPLTEIDVQNNEETIADWAKRAKGRGDDEIDSGLVSSQGRQNNGFGSAQGVFDEFNEFGDIIEEQRRSEQQNTK